MNKKIVFLEIDDTEKEYVIQKLGTENVVFINKNITELSEEDWDLIKDTEILSPFIYSPINDEVVNRLPQLKYIVTRSTGFDHINLQSLKAKDIKGSNVPSYGENTVAEHTFALILSLSRHIPESLERTKKGNFDLSGLQGFDLKGKTIGVIGTGNIGEHVVRIANGFEMNILAFSRTKKPELVDKYKVNYVSLEQLLQESDIITLHLPFNDQTKHIINKNNINDIKRGAIFINTSRGGLIETEALVRALDQGIFSAAGVDVLEEEGLIKEEKQLLSKEFKQADMLTALENHYLLSRPNVIVTPHNAFNSKEALIRILDVTLDNIFNYQEGRLINTFA